MKTVAGIIGPVLCVLLCLMPLAGADERERGKRSERGNRWSESDFNPRSVEGRAMIEKIMRARLRKELKLEEDEVACITTHFRSLSEDMTTLRRERFRLYKEVEKLAEAPEDDNASSAELAPLLNQLDTLDHEMREIRRKAFDAAAAPLQPWQQAKLYIFMARFEMDMRRLIERAKRKAEETRGEKENHGATEPRR